jgi:hypothetical protein
MSQQKLSFGDEISAARRKSEFGVVTVAAAAPAETTFSITVPKTWKRIAPAAPKPGDRPGWRALDGFAPSNGISVQLFQVAERYEVNLKDWLEYQASLLTLVPGAVQYGETEFGPMVHASAASREGDRLRLVAAADGPQVFVLMGRAARSQPADADAVLGLIAGSFLFRRHSGAVSREKLGLYIEPHKVFRLLYPQSWKVEPGQEDASRRVAVDFRVSGAEDTTAYVRVTADSRPAAQPVELKTLFENTVQELAAAGISIEDIEAVPAGAGGGERERWLGGCKLPSGRGQVALLFRRGEIGWMTAVMLAPGKTINPLAWMRAKRFYEILTASLGASQAQPARQGRQP